MADIQPTPKKISQVKKDLLNPATTSHFLVSVGLPSGGLGAVNKYQKEIGLNYDQERLNILCAQASLPGSRLLTAEMNNNFPGVTERHVYRRSFDESTNLTFYVDADQYLPIRFFESWMNYITNETTENIFLNAKDESFSYRMKFPNTYKGSLEITKFEKNIDSRRIRVITALAANQGLKEIGENIQDLNIYCACIDPELISESELSPGIGDPSLRIKTRVTSSD